MIRSGREAFLSREAARALGAGVGDTLPLEFYEESLVELGTFSRLGAARARVVGVGVFADEVQPDELFPRQKVIVTSEVGRRFDCDGHQPDRRRPPLVRGDHPHDPPCRVLAVVPVLLHAGARWGRGRGTGGRCGWRRASGRRLAAFRARCETRVSATRSSRRSGPTMRRTCASRCHRSSPPCGRSASSPRWRRSPSPHSSSPACSAEDRETRACGAPSGSRPPAGRSGSPSRPWARCSPVSSERWWWHGGLGDGPRCQRSGRRPPPRAPPLERPGPPGRGDEPPAGDRCGLGGAACRQDAHGRRVAPVRAAPRLPQRGAIAGTRARRARRDRRPWRGGVAGGCRCGNGRGHGDAGLQRQRDPLRRQPAALRVAVRRRRDRERGLRAVGPGEGRRDSRSPRGREVGRRRVVRRHRRQRQDAAVRRRPPGFRRAHPRPRRLRPRTQARQRDRPRVDHRQ